MKRFGNRQPLVVAGGFAVLTILVLLVMVMPKMSAVKDQQKQLDASIASGQQLAAQVGELRDAKNQAPQVKREIKKLELSIPDTTQLPRLFRQVQRVADDAAVDFVQISPGSPTPLTGYSSIPTQITATGSYFAVTEFLYNLEKLPRAVKITNWTMGPGPNGLPQLTMNLSTEVYTTDTSAGPGSQPGTQTGSVGGA